ncbi:MAG: MgtC/SapB family protein [Spartobacteria bacterium]
MIQSLGMIEWNWLEGAWHLGQMLIAFLITLPIAWNREQADRVMGLRTFPLVAMASCGFMLLAQSVFRDAPDAQARALQGIITGIGFIGAGAILKQDGNVKGSATAASIWNVGAIGAAVALNRYEIAVALGLADFLILRYLTKLKHGK